MVIGRGKIIRKNISKKIEKHIRIKKKTQKQKLNQNVE